MTKFGWFVSNVINHWRCRITIVLNVIFVFLICAGNGAGVLVIGSHSHVLIIKILTCICQIEDVLLLHG